MIGALVDLVRGNTARLRGPDHEQDLADEYLDRARCAEHTTGRLRRDKADLEETIRRMAIDMADLRARAVTAEARAGALQDPKALTVPADLYDNLVHLVRSARSLPELRRDASAQGVPL